MSYEIIDDNAQELVAKARNLYIEAKDKNPELASRFRPFQHEPNLALAEMYNVRNGSDYSQKDIINYFIAKYAQEYKTIPISNDVFESFFYRAIVQKVRQRTIFTVPMRSVCDKHGDNVLHDNTFKERLLSIDEVLKNIKAA